MVQLDDIQTKSCTINYIGVAYTSQSGLSVSQWEMQKMSAVLGLQSPCSISVLIKDWSPTLGIYICPARKKTEQ